MCRLVDLNVSFGNSTAHSSITVPVEDCPVDSCRDDEIENRDGGGGGGCGGDRSRHVFVVMSDFSTCYVGVYILSNVRIMGKRF